MKTQTTPGLLLQTITVATLLLAALPAPGGIQIVSRLPPSAAITNVGGGSSYDPIVTPDGRYALFVSTSGNLVAGPGGRQMPEAVLAHLNVFVRDRQAGVTKLVSVNAAGTAGGNDDSFPCAISSNGQFAVFESAASDLLAGATNGVGNVFVRDAVNNTTALVSVSTNGLAGNGESRDAAITPDGRYVAFVSAASNLAAGDQNGIPDVFVRDLQLGVTTLASPGARNFTGTSGTPLTAGSSSEGPVLSADGRYVAFYSTAVGLVANVTSVGELYVRDLAQGSTIWVSTNAHRVNSSAVSANYVMSTNGQFIAYQTTGGTPSGLVFRYNVATGACDAIATNGTQVTTLDSAAREIDSSADGRFVAFTLTDSSGGASIQLWDAQSGARSLISSETPGAQCDGPRLDQTGRYVAFTSDDAGLTTNSDGAWHIYRRDTATNTIQLADVGTNGATPIAFVTTPIYLSADGSVIGFDCQDGALSSNPYKSDAFLRDFGANTTEILSVPAPGLPSVTPLNSSDLTTSGVNSNGQYIAFVSSADGLVNGDTNGYPDVYVHDLVSGSNTLVSVSADGPYAGNANSFDPAISADGRYVAFTSYATDLVANDTNNASEVYLRDLQTGSTVLVSVGLGGSGQSSGDSSAPQISADGQRVLFLNLTNGNNANLFWRDLQAGATFALTSKGDAWAASMTPDGSNVLFSRGLYLSLWLAQSHSATNFATLTDPVVDVAISPDAHRAAFKTSIHYYAADLVAWTYWLLGAVGPTSSGHGQFSADSRFLVYLARDDKGTNQVYLYDFEHASSTLVSQSYNSVAPGNDVSDSPAISANGRLVAYRSAATNLVPDDCNGVHDIFLYDRLTGGTTLISVSLFGAYSANGLSLCPVFSGDGQTLVFESWASDLAPDDFNQSSDVFALSLSINGPANPTNAAPPPTLTGITWQTANGQLSANQPLGLTWLAAPGAGYEVQFKNSLTDPQWQPLNGPATVVGQQGSIIDFSPDPAHRFYRIVSF